MNAFRTILTIAILVMLYPVSAADYIDRHFRLNDSSGNSPELMVRYKYLTSSSFFDTEGRQRSKLYRTVDEFSDPEEYTYQYSENSLILGLKWNPDKDITLLATMPLTLFSLEEKYYYYYTVVDSATGSSWTDRVLRQIKDYSLFRIEYLSVLGKYSIHKGRAKAELGLELRVPSGFTNSLAPANGDNFLSDGAFELIPSVFFQVDFRTISLQSSMKFIKRWEELSDAFYFSTSSNLSTIPGTNFIIGMEYFRSLEQYKYAVSYNPRFTTQIEDYLRANLGFGMQFGKNAYFEFNYLVTMFGKNTSSSGTGILSANISL